MSDTRVWPGNARRNRGVRDTEGEILVARAGSGCQFTLRTEGREFVVKLSGGQLWNLISMLNTLSQERKRRPRRFYGPSTLSIQDIEDFINANTEQPL